MHEVAFQQISKVYDAVHNNTINLIQYWMTYSLNTWRWWITVALTILPWVIWIIVRKKDSTARLLFAGVIVMVIASSLENVGISLGFWWFQYKILPIPTTNVMWSYSLLPVITMLLLQFKPKINPLIKATVLGAGGSFIGLPIFKWLGMYHPKQWSHFYSFFIVIVIYLIAHFVVKRSSFSRLEN